MESFPYIADDNSRVLILGTMPGNDSIKAGQYYHHPNNLFWDIMFRVFIRDWKNDDVVSSEYQTKVNLLFENRIALWDVLKVCERKGTSLDKDIGNQSCNDFKEFFEKFPKIRIIFFNGKEASKHFEHFRQEPNISNNRAFIILQSTSPSNKTNSFFILKEWMQIKNKADEN